MKKTLKTTVNILIIIVLIISIQSCEMFGLEYQTNYDNTYAPIQTELNMTAYEFIESRKGIDMALTFEAIQKAELRSLYETDSLTYFLIDDVQFASMLTGRKISSVATAQKGELQMMLKGYIVKGLFHSSKMSTTPIQVKTENGVNVLQMRLYPRASSFQDLYQINAGYVFSTGVTYRTVISSNMKSTNGIIHILQVRL